MIRIMKKQLIAVILALTFALSAPTVSFASTNDEEAPTHDARLDGYKDGNMALKDASGNHGRAAEVLQITYKSLTTKLREYGLE